MTFVKMREKWLDEKRQGETLSIAKEKNDKKKMYIESYGCQMNFSDSEIVASILTNEGFCTTNVIEEADLVFVNTCSVREKAEQTVRRRLQVYNSIKKKNNPGMIVGVLGCMAERLKEKFLEEEKLVDIVVGPDAYRDLPNLIRQVDDGRKAVNVILSKEETYAEISPVRFGGNGVTAFVSITRGCDNMCTFCVVPFTRGRERSRNPESIINECKQLITDGYKEVTLLGQNVDSYLWFGGGAKKEFKNLNEKEKENSTNFAQLIEMVAKINQNLRVRFSTSNPQDMRDEVLNVMAKHKNICNYIHLPVQSGSNRILDIMKRGYTKEEYLGRIKKIREILPDCGISMDMIAGFCSESEKDYKDTLDLMDQVKFDFGYMFKYSERPNTSAQRKFEDDVIEETKQIRLAEIIEKQMAHSLIRNKETIGKTYEVLIEGESKKSKDKLFGRTAQNKVVVFDRKNYKKGQYVSVKIESCTAATLMGKVI
ncbi:MAG TPA: tRNA (N6-isopentenyl adenosine(37)-C2)-methylthiotransferase MiaB [Flavobacteriales bacterium]|jgi:tRNA-2-methylthio-N6-dimethylallyladenosine synthase|nr:tRNA (N6-isopentenyl adenosine(37)-C2)-methylthiotransferase MiaB [Flavobacteriales bacterium]|tara:strand:- start:3251 stop:4699 length:1449 start_codon:yes stop_codon:yes gene_type:complete